MFCQCRLALFFGATKERILFIPIADIELFPAKTDDDFLALAPSQVPHHTNGNADIVAPLRALDISNMLLTYFPTCHYITV